MKIALIGHGKWGKNHSRILYDAGHDVSTYDIDDWPHLIGDLNHFDAAVVTASTVNHFQITQQCYEEGIPVYCEKPVCISNAHYSLMSKWDTDFPFMAGHQLIFHPEVSRLRSCCQSMSAFRTGAVPRTEGAVLSLSVHDIAIMCHVFENPEDIQHIYAEGHIHTAMTTFGNPSTKAYASCYAASVATARMRHSWFRTKGGNIITITPDNWNRLDLLCESLTVFCKAAKAHKAPKVNNLPQALCTMNLTLQAHNAILEGGAK